MSRTILLLLLFRSSIGSSQPTNTGHNKEISISNLSVYSVLHESMHYGFLIQYVQVIKHTKLGLGFGYERIYDELQHYSFGPVLSYKPFSKFNISVFPTIELNTYNTQRRFSLHIESSYDLRIRDVLIGPVLEFASNPEETHISLGAHLGFSF